MGIQGLTNAVSRYGVFSPFGGSTVVIDGPALVHRILSGILKHRPYSSSFLCQPSYSLLGSMVIGWLDNLQNHDITVRKIYFDGYLPPSKWQVRRDRLYTQTDRMKMLRSSNPYGSAKLPENTYANVKAGISLTNFVGASSGKLPKPPFLVPAVLELLMRSEHWGPRVQVVPGEADMFCAEDVRQNGGTVLTTDSDLLVEDLGQNGTVAFFWDVVPNDPSSRDSGLSAQKYSYRDINKQLGIMNLGGLLRVAFEKVRGRIGFKDAVELVKAFRGALDEPEWQDFVNEHRMKEHVSPEHQVLDIISTLDPRLSEVVIQTILIEQQGIVPDESRKRTQRGPERLSIFLPVLIESLGIKKSAWSASTRVRQLAYGILQDIARHRSANIIEYRTIESSTNNSATGREVRIHSPGETSRQCALLAATLSRFSQHPQLADMPWLAFAIYQDIEWSTSEGRAALSAALIHAKENEVDDTEEYPWDLVDFTASIQASLYSLRLVKQILEVAAFMKGNLSAPALQLRESLASLPIISEWPAIEDMPRLLSRFRDTNALTSIAEVTGFQETAKPPEFETPEKKKRVRTETILGRQKRPRSVNRYAALSLASQD